MSNIFDQFDSDTPPGDVDLLERARLNQVESYYRSTLAGASKLRTMSQIAQLRAQGAGDEDIIKEVRGVPLFNVGGMQKLTPEQSLARQKMWIKEQEDTYNTVLSDLSRYDRMKPWTDNAWGTAVKATNPIAFMTSPEAVTGAMSLLGQVLGGAQSPENYAGAVAKGGTLAVRSMVAGAQQGGLQAIVDPLVQAMNMKSGVQKEYEPWRTAGAVGLGAIVGGGLHMGGELLSSGYIKNLQKQLSVEDPSFKVGGLDEAFPMPAEVLEKTGKAAKLYDEQLPLIDKGGLTVQSRKAADTRFQKVGKEEADIVPRPEVQTLQQLSNELSDSLGMTTRQGRVAEGIGQYDTRQAVARVNELPDFETVVHESGHFLEQKIGKPLRDLQDQFPTELAKLDLTGDGNIREGFSEYLRRFVGSPKNAAREAPGFDKAFRQFMEANHPDRMSVLTRMQEALDTYKNARPEEVIGASVISETDKPGFIKRTMAALTKAKLPSTISTVMSDSYRAVLDENAPLDKFVRAMAASYKEKTGNLLPLKDIDNPAYHARMLHEGARSAGLQDAQFGVAPYRSINPEGPSLFEAISHAIGQPTVMGKWDAQRRKLFSNYLVARMGEVAWEKHAAGLLPNDPVPFSSLAAQKAIKKAEQVFPEFRQASEMVNEWNRNLLKKVFDAGLITQERYDAITAQRFYVPLLRDVSDKGLTQGGASAEKAGGNIVKRMMGSQRDILDPIESMMTQSYLVNRSVRYNDMMRAFTRLSKIGGGGKWVEEVPALEAKKYTVEVNELLKNVAKDHNIDPDDLILPLQKVLGDDPIQGVYFRMEKAPGRGEPLLHYYEDGVMKVLRMGTDKEGTGLYEIMTSVPRGLSDIWSNLIIGTTSIARAGVVTDLAYMASNYIRDQMQAAILRNDYIPIVTGLRGIADELSQGKGGTRDGYNPARLYAYMGGVSAGAVATPVQKAIDRDINALAKQGWIVNRFTSLRGFMELTQTTEAGTRNSVFSKAYEQGLKQGLNEYDAAFSAAFQAKDLLDFNRHGSRTMAIRNFIPFINANFQGLDKARRTMLSPLLRKAVLESDIGERNNAIASLTKFLGVGATLGFGWAALQAEKEGYRDASPRLIGTHIVGQLGNDRVFTIPKPFELGLGFTLGEYAYKRMVQDDPRSAEHFLEATMEAIKPPNPLTDIPLMKATVELQTGKSLFTGRDIVPDRLKALPGPEQYTELTSPMAKSVGRITGWSPMKVDYAIGSMFTSWGRNLVAMSAGTEDSAPSKRWEDAVFARRFIKDPNRTSDVTTKFWEYMAKTTGKYNQANTAVSSFIQRHQDDRAYKFLESLPADQKAWVILQSGGSGREAAFTPDERRVHPLRRAYDAVGLLNRLRFELIENAFEVDGEQVKMSPEKRRDLIDGVRELAQMEMRNGLVAIGEPGYKGRQLFSVDDTLAKIKAMSPEVGNEIAKRYATAKIYKSAAIANEYNNLKTTILQGGTSADLGEITNKIVGEGYEFGAERVKRQYRRKIEVKGTGQ